MAVDAEGRRVSELHTNHTLTSTNGASSSNLSVRKLPNSQTLNLIPKCRASAVFPAEFSTDFLGKIIH